MDTNKCTFCDNISNENNFSLKHKNICDTCYNSRCFICTEKYEMMSDVKLISASRNNVFIYSKEKYEELIKNRHGNRCSCSSPHYRYCSQLSKICDYCIYNEITNKTDGLEYKICRDNFGSLYMDVDKSNLYTDLMGWRNSFEDLSDSDDISEKINNNFSVAESVINDLENNCVTLNDDFSLYKETTHKIFENLINHFYNYKVDVQKQITELKNEIENLKKK